MSKKISIIIPVFNAEENLEMCLGSIQKQIYQDFEVLLIDDGSTDESLSICKRFEQFDSVKYRVFTQNNSGPGVARNTGLDHMTGEYVVFIDSDDYVYDNYFNEIIHVFDQWGGNVVQFGYNTVNENYVHIKSSTSKTKYEIFDSDVIVAEYARGNLLDMFLWSKAFRSDSLRNYRFKSLYYAEDQLFLTEYFYDQRKILLTDKCFYNYVMSPNSLVRSEFNVNKIDGILAARLMYELHLQNNRLNSCFASEKICYYIATMFESLISVKFADSKSLLSEFKFHFENIKRNKKLCSVNNKRKVLYYSFNIMPRTTYHLYNKLRRRG